MDSKIYVEEIKIYVLENMYGNIPGKMICVGSFGT